MAVVPPLGSGRLDRPHQCQELAVVDPRLVQPGLEAALRARRAAGGKLLVPYVMGGMTDDWVEVLQAVVAAGAAGVVVGSALVRRLIEGGGVEAAATFVGDLRAALDRS